MLLGLAMRVTSRTMRACGPDGTLGARTINSPGRERQESSETAVLVMFSFCDEFYLQFSLVFLLICVSYY